VKAVNPWRWVAVTMIFALEILNFVSKSLILSVVQSAARDPEREGMRQGGEAKLPDPSKKHTHHTVNEVNQDTPSKHVLQTTYQTNRERSEPKHPLKTRTPNNTSKTENAFALE